MPLFESKRNADGTYGPTNRGDYYISKPDHRRTARKNRNKTRWKIQENQEFSVFVIANENYFYCSINKCLFSVVNDCKKILGKNGERVAKFPDTVNPADAWHGYPVKTQKKNDRPSSEVLDIIEKCDLISPASRIKIEKGWI